MKNTMYPYLLNDKIKNHSMILCTEIECKKCGEKIYVEFQTNEKFIFKCPNCSRKNRKVFYAFCRSYIIIF
ncbi:hypothetical protein E1E49_03805 [Campylobacter jejuni]|uniref:Uncharacterized protein n=3 Tax=Campylobacter jejuni TaxID=197 RepID=A0A5T0ZDY8_CAMJU|nr:hypothetical protein PJ19_09735 [Campylobacter jejuni subsp. jejuni]AMP66144.1 hypothetical protein A0W68_09500 [Campylobacter jejuni]EAC1287403.1 hypothetical protein [Campylobacter coli]ETJ81703.1 hypothetical protein X908_07925 [Campylobacter jejuni subsp. jejuni 81-176-DRH212]ETJ82761.1 hypothetical protein X909_08900 [Campylobacter jejuni subsp. jejuni 81-176-UMCW7]ETN89792.1 hypothetical protein X910_08855 [Campylobacter jejuni subsp. jejuni 81-176-UMCW9]